MPVLVLLWLQVSLAASQTLLFEGQATNALPDEQVVDLTLACSVDQALPGTEVVLALVLDIAPGHHLVADQAQLVPQNDFSPYPLRVAVETADEGLTFMAASFPQAHLIKLDESDLSLMTFEGRTVVYLPVHVDANAQPGPLSLKLKVAYQACNARSCLIPVSRHLTHELKVAPAGGASRALTPELFAGYRPSALAESAKVGFKLFDLSFAIDVTSGVGVGLLLLTAALGGLLLNFTPCVLPLVPIKIISLAEAAQSRQRCLQLGLAMFLGVVTFWMALGMLIAFVSEFTAANQLFHYPAFTITVGLVIALMAMGMCGLFAFKVPQFVYRFNPRQDNCKGCWALGILAAVLSTPCTAPFMGAAAAWAATQQPATTLLTFACIGTGMALPYMVLSAAPGLVRRLPRSGPSSVLLEQVMGLFMLAAAAYFVGTGVSTLVVAPPDPPSKIYWWAVMFFVAAGGGWLTLRAWQLARRPLVRQLMAGIGVLIIAAAGYGGTQLTAKDPIDWIYYTPERYSEVFEQRQAMLMVFSAEWCLNCKAMEHLFAKSPAFIDALKQHQVLPIKVDLTGENPAAKAKLKEVGSLTIPLLIIYAADGSEVFRCDFCSVDEVIGALEAVHPTG